jgi:hypothetical protein
MSWIGLVLSSKGPLSNSINFKKGLNIFNSYIFQVVFLQLDKFIDEKLQLFGNQTTHIN